MGFFDIFRTSTKAVDTAADLIKAGADGIDKLWFTSEEKSDASAKFYENWLGMITLMVDTESIRSITRRYIAISVIGVWLYLVLFGTTTFVFGGSESEKSAEFVFKVIDSMTWQVVAIIGFYFGPEMISRMLDKIKK